LSDESAWSSLENRVVGYVSDDVCAHADDHVFSDAKARSDSRADADHRVVAYLAVSPHACAGGDMTATADPVVVRYHGAVVNDATVAKPHFGIDDRSGFDEIPFPHLY